MNKLKISCPLVCAALLAACAPLSGGMRGYASTGSRLASYPSAQVYPTWYAAAKAMLRPAGSALELSRDESVGATGVLGQTVNEVVPIPGTDMIRVGALQEGTFFQSSFRSANQEAAAGAGRTGTVLIFRIFRP